MATVLHWLAGAKNGDGVNDSTACIDPPETPAPVFAVRAFRHALFGTPQTTQPPKTRRHSTTENRPRHVESPRPTRPRMDRPKSANDANALMPPSSPTKGILMTPGTAAAKKKNVTFGDHVLENEEKRPLRSGLPEDCPGKFPSPWKRGMDGEHDAPLEPGSGRTKLTEALEQARDESRQRRTRPDSEAPAVASSPENECCAFWRHEYDVYRTNTQREVKKLVKKYKAAKDYAQSKDDEAADLRLHLQEAETKADALEEAVHLLTSQIKEMEQKLQAQSLAQSQPLIEAKPEPGRTDKGRDRPRDLQALLEMRGSKERTASATTVKTDVNDQLQRPSEPRNAAGRRVADADQLQRPSEPVGTLGQEKTEPGRAQQPGAGSHLMASRRRAEMDQLQKPSEPTTRAGRRSVESPENARPVERSSESQPPAADTGDSKPARQPPAQDEPGQLLAEPDQPPTTGRTTTTKRLITTGDPERQTTNDPVIASHPTGVPPSPDMDPLHLPSDPAIYDQSPSSPTHHAETHPSPPSPPPPAHATGTLPPRSGPARQDIGVGTLRPLSVNARSGNGVANVNVHGNVARAVRGRDGKEIDAARLEAARARIRGRGRDVS